MKNSSITILFLGGFLGVVEASTIRIQVSSVVEESIATQGESPSVGTPFTGWFEYETPRLVDNVGDPLFFEYQGVFSRGEVDFLGEIYSLSGLSVSVSKSSIEGLGWYVGFTAEIPLDQVDDEYNRLVLNFFSDTEFVDDPTRLPSSLEEWNLAIADPTVIFSREGLDQNMLSEVWTVRSSNLTSLSMSEVPEPSGVMLLGLSCVLGVMRRKRTA